MGGYNPGTGPYNNPQITIANPLAPPGLQLTNVASLLQTNMVGTWVFKNGLLLTKGPDYTQNGAQITFTVAPISSDILVASVFQLGLQLGGATPQRYVAPVSFLMTGALCDGGWADLLDRDGPDDLRDALGRNKQFVFGGRRNAPSRHRSGTMESCLPLMSTWWLSQTAFVFLP